MAIYVIFRPHTNAYQAKACFLGRAFLVIGKVYCAQRVGDAPASLLPQIQFFKCPTGCEGFVIPPEPLDKVSSKDIFISMASIVLDPETISEIIEMALSDHASFAHIQSLHGLDQNAVKALMRESLRPGSYRAWRRRVRQFSDRREVYK